mmetsp:Transcript_48456/g.136982  ORF Transcript_48456/g.136982 Transcript_48456/m.136982 type:complete len:349 (-) Transcript_48456:255-1301(-)
MGGAGPVHVLRPTRRGGQLRRRHGAHRHVPRGHGEDANAGIPREARRAAGGAVGGAQRGDAGIHAGFHRDRRRLHPRAHRVLHRLRGFPREAGRLQQPGPASRARSALRRPGNGGARRRPDSTRRREAAAAAGLPQGRPRLHAFHVGARGRARVLPEPARHAGHEHPLHGDAGRSQRRAEGRAAPRAGQLRGVPHQRALVLLLRRRERGRRRRPDVAPRRHQDAAADPGAPPGRSCRRSDGALGLAVPRDALHDPVHRAGGGRRPRFFSRRRAARGPGRPVGSHQLGHLRDHPDGPLRPQERAGRAPAATSTVEHEHGPPEDGADALTGCPEAAPLSTRRAARQARPV